MQVESWFTATVDSLVNGARIFTSHRFFSRREPLQSVWQVIGWWEARRVPYNLIVGVTGLATGGIMLVAGLVTETYLGEAIGIPGPLFVVFAVAFYAIMANICFTCGWAIEILVNRIWGKQAESFGPISFTLGLLFCSALTLAPAILVVGVVVFRMVWHMFVTALK